MKDREVSREALNAFWAGTVREQGVDLQVIRDRAERLRLESHEPLAAEEKRDRARSALAFATEHVSERKAAFSGRELLGAALRQGMGAITLEDVRQALREDKEPVKVESAASPSHRFTTAEALRLELRNIQAMR